MRIPNLTMSDALVTRLNTINIKQGQYNDQIANGQRISLASEDPQAAGRILRLQSERSAIDSYSKNAERALGISQASFAALNRLKDLSDRATELAALSISGNVSAQERKAYAVEVNSLLQSAIEVANTTHQGEYLFNGTNTATNGAAPYVQSGTSPFSLTAPIAPVVTNPATNPVTVTAGSTTVTLNDIAGLSVGQTVSGVGIPLGTTVESIDANSGTLVLSAAPTSSAATSLKFANDGALIKLSPSVTVAPFTSGDANSKIGGFIRNIAALLDALNTDSTSGISTAQSNLLSSEDHLVSMMADNASNQARLESVKIQNAERVNNLQTLIARDADVDIAQTMVNLTRARTSYQAALEAGAQVLKLSLLDYIR
jgi:flagellar hook-associated protein 3 FlgL